MTSELVSLARPSPARLLGFAAVAGGALLLGVGALSQWVVLSFPDEIDPSGASATPVHGVDVWEGKAAFAAAIVILALAVAVRVVGAGRVAIASAIVAIAVVAAGIATVTAVRADERFVTTDGLDAFAEALADDLGVSVQQVRATLERLSRETLEVDRGIGLSLAIAGGVVAAAGGVLTLRSVRSPDASMREDETSVPR
jgi:uncharacterized membrane protein YeiB